MQMYQSGRPKAKDLAQRFVKNFAKYEGNEAGKALVSAGPQIIIIKIIFLTACQ